MEGNGKKRAFSAQFFHLGHFSATSYSAEGGNCTVCSLPIKKVLAVRLKKKLFLIITNYNKYFSKSYKQHVYCKLKLRVGN